MPHTLSNVTQRDRHNSSLTRPGEVMRRCREKEFCFDELFEKNWFKSIGLHKRITQAWCSKSQNVLPQLFSSESSLQSFLPSQSCRGAMHSPDGHKKLIEIHLQLFSSDSSTQLKSPSHRSLLFMQTPLSHWKSSAVHEYPEMIGNNSTMIGMP